MINFNTRYSLILSFTLSVFSTGFLDASAEIRDSSEIETEASLTDQRPDQEELFFQCEELVFSQLDEMIEFQNLSSKQASTTITECSCLCRAGYDTQLDGRLPMPEGGCQALVNNDCRRYADGQDGFYEACWEVTRKLNWFERCWRRLFG